MTANTDSETPIYMLAYDVIPNHNYELADDI